jgi:hypothetical protein
MISAHSLRSRRLRGEEIPDPIHRRAAPLVQAPADNNMKLGIEQVGKGGLPPLALATCNARDEIRKASGGASHPSRLVLFEGLSPTMMSYAPCCLAG